MSVGIMGTRSGEKIGWIGGWSGGFLWLLILSVIWLVKKQPLFAVLGILLVALALGCIVMLAPWRHPHTPYWKLFLPIYLVLFAAVGLAVWAGGFAGLHLGWGSLFWLLPLFIPFATAGNRRWDQ
jgi:hypothetical protein